jgi:cell division transport system permease protein
LQNHLEQVSRCLATTNIVDVLVAEYLAPQLPFTSFIGLGSVWLVAPYLVLGGVILATTASGVSIRRYLRT